MTDKVQIIRKEVERLKEIAEYNLSHCKMDRSAWIQQASVCTNLLSFIDSMQEECNITGIKSKHATGKLKECIDNITDESLAKARKQLEEEPKKCMYSKDNYTDEDRKVLCGGCEEECRFNKKEEPVSEDLEEAIRKYEKRLEKENPATEAYDFASAIRFGAAWQKEQLMNNAITAEYWDNSLMLDAEMRGKYSDGNIVKLIIIKED